MKDASLWRAGDCPTVDEGALERWVAVRRLAVEAMSPDDHDQALMAPKLASKLDPALLEAGPDAAFKTRAVAAQIGWLETSIAAAAVEALCRIEILLSQGLSETSKLVHHELMVFEAFEAGLLATWETPAELACVPRLAAI
jgi:hypothetical protein